MFVVLTQPVDCLRLGPNAPAGMVAAVGDDLGRELVAKGQAAELTLAEFQERLLARQNGESGTTPGLSPVIEGSFTDDAPVQSFSYISLYR